MGNIVLLLLLCKYCLLEQRPLVDMREKDDISLLTTSLPRSEAIIWGQPGENSHGWLTSVLNEKPVWNFPQISGNVRANVTSDQHDKWKPDIYVANYFKFHNSKSEDMVWKTSRKNRRHVQRLGIQMAWNVSAVTKASHMTWSLFLMRIHLLLRETDV